MRIFRLIRILIVGVSSFFLGLAAAIGVSIVLGVFPALFDVIFDFRQELFDNPVIVLVGGFVLGLPGAVASRWCYRVAYKFSIGARPNWPPGTLEVGATRQEAPLVAHRTDESVGLIEIDLDSDFSEVELETVGDVLQDALPDGFSTAEIGVSLGTADSGSPSLVTVNLYSKGTLVVSIKCHIVSDEDYRFSATNRQRETLHEMLRDVCGTSNLINAGERFEKIGKKRDAVRELLLADKASENSSLSNAVHDLMAEYIAWALVPASEEDLQRMVGHMDVAITKLLQAAITLPYRLKLREWAFKGTRSESDQRLLACFAAMNLLFMYRHTLFTLLREHLSAHSVLHEESCEIIDEFIGWYNANKPETGFRGVIELSILKVLLYPLLFFFANHIPNFSGDVAKRYSEALAEIVGLELDEEEFRQHYAWARNPGDAVQAIVESLDFRLDQIVATREELIP